MTRKVFCNRTLNMKRINYIGVDMDHTLVRYNSENFERLAHKVMCEKLVSSKGYPKSILKLPFDYNRAIRGLVVDKVKGNLLKLSRHAAIRSSYHGTSRIDFSVQNRLYKSTYIDLKDKKFDKIDTTFSISFAVVFSQLVDLKEGSEKNQLPDFSVIADDLNFVLDQAHRDGSLKNVVREKISNYIVKDPEVVHGIDRYLKHGKKFFIVTNSDFDYAKLLLDHTINPYLKGSRSWLDIFSHVIVNAQKPSFFFEDKDFLRLDPKTGKQSGSAVGLSPGLYEGGCAGKFTDALGLEPDEILYIGDHIYGDIVRLKKDCAWRTALVVEELDQEMLNLQKAKPFVKKISALMTKKVPLETKIDRLISSRIESGRSGQQAQQAKIDRLIEQSLALDKKIGQLIGQQQKMHNPYWGEVMRIGIEESYFAYQVDRFACIYMARLSYLLKESPRTYFRSSLRALPHEIV